MQDGDDFLHVLGCNLQTTISAKQNAVASASGVAQIVQVGMRDELQTKNPKP